MTVDDLLARARSQIGKQTRYALGGGTVSGTTCQDPSKACDCSGFVLWCLQWRRRYPDEAWLKKATGGWLNTDGIWYDSVTEVQVQGRFVSPCERTAGALIVYPASWMTHSVLGMPKGSGPQVGHIGILTAPDKVIHCSAGNWRKCGDAITQTGTEIFDRVSATRTVWPHTVTRGV